MSEWISVKDRMPEKEGKYIVCVAGNVCVLPMIVNGVGYKYWETGKYFKKEMDKVSHWMPFPEPPKEG